jgi:hypothetical protein
MRKEGEAGFVERAAVTDAGDDILERSPLRHVIVHIIRRDERHIRVIRESCKLGESRNIVFAVEPGHGE